MIPGFLAVDGVRKAFLQEGRRLPVLDGVTFAASQGEFVALVGPSGCGKSTLLEIVCGLQAPDSGSVRVGGARNSSERKVAYMPQSDLLFPWRRLIDNVILPLQVQRVPVKTARRRAREWLPLFGLEGFEEAYPSQLSGGMRQRAALLRTFLSGRDVVALDEPFGALDAYTRRTMQEWLGRIRRQLQKTILLVTHDVEEALLLADRVVVLSRRPARVAAEFAVSLGEERDVLSPEFTALKGKVLERLVAGASPGLAGEGEERSA